MSAPWLKTEEYFIDKGARDHLPHRYGAAGYTVIDELRQLPLKASDIDRRLTA